MCNFIANEFIIGKCFMSRNIIHGILMNEATKEKVTRHHAFNSNVSIFNSYESDLYASP